MIYIIGIAVSLLVLMLWCCLKVASDEDDMYERIFRERYGYKSDNKKE